jgi:hypothetical protein
MGFIKKYGLLILFSVFCAASCAKVKQTNELQEVYRKPVIKNTVSLNSGNFEKWTLFFGIQDKNAPQTPKELQHSTFQKIDATVPGNVEIDLERAGLIEDPSIGDNIYQLRKYESYHGGIAGSLIDPTFRKITKLSFVLKELTALQIFG